MSHIATAWARQQITGNGTAKSILLYLADRADDVKFETYPSITTIAEHLEFSRSTIQDNIRKLEVQRLIKISQRTAPSGSNTSSLYTLPVPAEFTIKRDKDTARQPGTPARQPGSPIPAAGPGVPDSRATPARQPGHILSSNEAPPEAPSEASAQQAATGKNGHHDGREGLSLEPDLATPEQTTWAAYREAYARRYKTDPVRNAKVNGQIKQLVKRLGKEAPDIAAFYLTHNARFYVEKCHAVGNLLADAEKLRTEWATGRRVSSTQAQQADKSQNNQDLIAEARAHFQRQP